MIKGGGGRRLSRFKGQGVISDPTVISGAVAWFDASDSTTITITSGKVSDWLDKVVTGPNLNQPTAGKRPLYGSAVQNGLNAVLFDGAATWLGATTATLLRSVAGWTIFATCKTASTGHQRVVQVEADPATFVSRANMAVFLSGTGDWSMWGVRNNNDTETLATDPAVVSTTNWAMVVGIGNYTATTGTLRVNGRQVAQNTSWLTSGNTPNNNGALYVGTGSAGVLSLFNGYIGEILIYNRALASAEVGLVEGYLKVKWAV